MNRMFELDWSRVVEKGRVVRMLIKEAGRDETVVRRIKKACKEYYELIVTAFTYYSTIGDGDEFSIQVCAPVMVRLSCSTNRR